MKVYGALEVAQLEWFTNAGKPAASNYAYRVIWVTDLKEIQVSDGSNWISFNSDQDARFDNTIDSSSTGANAAVPATTNLITLTNASLTSIGALSSPVEGRLAVVVNKTGAAITIVNEDSGNTAANRILTGNGADISIANNGSFLALYNSNDSRWHNISAVPLLDASVTNAKLANVATQTFKGRTTAGTGVPEDLTATQATAILNTVVGDSGSGGTKGLVPAPSAGDAAAGKFLKASGSFTVVSGADLTAATVTNAKLANMATQTIKGRTTAGTGDPEDLTATQATALLNAMVGDSGSGGTKGLVPAPAAGDAAAAKYLGAGGTWSAITVADDAITNAKLANMATQTFKGRTTAGTGDPEDLSATQATAILNAFTGDSGSGGVKGLVPAPSSGDNAAEKFLKAGGTWAAPFTLVGARAKTTNAQAITNGSSNVITTWTTEDYDTDSAFNTTSGVFTVPTGKGGYYRISACIGSTSTSWTTGSNRYVQLNVTGTKTCEIGFCAVWASITDYIVVFGTTVFNYAAGDTISITLANSSGSTFTLSGANTENWISIERIGI